MGRGQLTVLEQEPSDVGLWYMGFITQFKFFRDPAIFHDGHLVADGVDSAYFMGDQNNRDAESFIDLFEESQDGTGHLGVDGRGRFVAEQYLRFIGKRPRNCHSLLLASTELGRIGLRLFSKSDNVQALRNSLFTFRFRIARDFQGKRDVFRHSPIIEQIEMLKDHADGLPLLVQLSLGQLRYIPPVDDDFAAQIGPFQKVDCSEKRRFTRTTKTDDTVDVTLVDL